MASAGWIHIRWEEAGVEQTAEEMEGSAPGTLEVGPVLEVCRVRGDVR